MMTTTRKSTIARLFALMLTLALVGAFAVGCEKKEESKPAGEKKTEEAAAAGEGEGTGTAGEEPAAEAPAAAEPAADEPAAAAEQVAVEATGSTFDPPVEKAQIPGGAWICDMGTVHYAALEAGDGVCPICKMKLVQHGAGDAPAAVDHGDHGAGGHEH